MTKLFCALGAALLISCLSAGSAWATGATLIFKSGLRVYVNNGYDKIVDSLSKIEGDARHKVISLDVEGGIFLLDVAEVVIACKERCTSIDLIDTRATKAGAGQP